MADLMKASVDASDLGALEKQLPHEKDTFANFDEYEKHQKATEKEIIGNYVCSILFRFVHCKYAN
jgi:hypothetical protein